jgi:hypothetical protein
LGNYLHLIFYIWFLFCFIADEIATAISSPGLSQRDAIDDDDLLRELDELAQEEDQKQILDIGPLPDVPVTTTNDKVKEKDNPQRELEAWMNS